MKRKVTLIALFSLALAIAACAQATPGAVRILDGPRVEGTGDTWAVIAWTTSAGGSSIVRYGTNQSSLTQIAESPYSGAKVHEGKVTHRVHLKGLTPNTTYYFLVDSGQGSGTGTEAKSGVMNFQTKAAGTASAMPPSTGMGEAGENQRHAAVKITNGPRVEGTGDTWAVIAWTTNEASSSIIRYGTSPSSLNQVAEASYADVENANKQTHRVHINNLKPHTTYYFMVDSGQGEGTGTEARSNVSQFTTK